MANAKIILASGSPRRRQILNLAGIPHDVIVSNADETVDGEPDKQVTELALRKARAVLAALSATSAPSTSSARPASSAPSAHLAHEEKSEKIIIAADTLVFIDGKVLGKPTDKQEAFEMLKSLSGRMHTVYTGVAIIRGEDERIFADAAKVHFHTLSDAVLNAYIATGEPFDKAGAYGVQERGAVLVKKIDGDFYTVVGLPISRVCHYLTELGYDIWDNAEKPGNAPNCTQSPVGNAQ